MDVQNETRLLGYCHWNQNLYDDRKSDAPASWMEHGVEHAFHGLPERNNKGKHDWTNAAERHTRPAKKVKIRFTTTLYSHEEEKMGAFVRPPATDTCEPCLR